MHLTFSFSNKPTQITAFFRGSTLIRGLIKKFQDFWNCAGTESARELRFAALFIVTLPEHSYCFIILITFPKPKLQLFFGDDVELLPRFSLIPSIVWNRCPFIGHFSLGHSHQENRGLRTGIVSRFLHLQEKRVWDTLDSCKNFEKQAWMEFVITASISLRSRLGKLLSLWIQRGG